jgi:DNA helicase II / ATP-dependent DNA helicase PcrA
MTLHDETDHDDRQTALQGSDMPPSILDALNEEQRQAVLETQGPLLVLAGAGTGKTRVLTTRIAHILLNKLAWPGEILAVTFTNKAAREMGVRINDMMGGGMEPEGGRGSVIPWMGTFHSIGAKIIRRHAERLGLTSSFTILDDDDQIRLIKAILVEFKVDDKSLPPKLFLSIIQSWKDQGLTPDKITNSRDKEAGGGFATSVYTRYQQRLREVNACDFGDLILHMLTLFTEYQDILQEYAKRFKYILVDEYQDTNVSQYLWLRLLASYHKNICCVGDDDQSIYSWRGAEVGNILRFERDYPDAKVVRLECNYRSTPHILAAASELIANNQGRLGKTLWTPTVEGEKIHLKSVWDEAEEARYVGEEVEQQQRKGTSLQNMAILVRAGFQTRAFEERFLTLGVPYRVVGGLRFYERAEIRDAVAYLRLISSPNDDLAFERIVNTPKRGIGQATLQQLHSAARSINGSLYSATIHLLESGSLKGKLGAALDKFIQNCENWRAQLSAMNVAEVTELMLDESGYRQMWQQDKSPEAAGRLENLKELTRAIGDFENLSAFLEHVSLVTDNATDNGQTDMVSLMTLHAAKGLEFDTVFLPGWEEGVFPHQRALDESGSKGLEEERRLAYVGITRARKKLYITHAANRRIYNQWQSSIPSRFIAEIPQDHVEKLSGGLYNARPTQQAWQSEVASIMQTAARSHASKNNPAIGGNASRSSSAAVAHNTLEKGTRIFHQKFGYGRITSISGSHLEIAFEKAGQKKVLADFVEKV